MHPTFQETLVFSMLDEMLDAFDQGLKGSCKVKSLHLHKAEILKISHSNRTCTQSQQRTVSQ